MRSTLFFFVVVVSCFFVWPFLYAILSCIVRTVFEDERWCFALKFQRSDLLIFFRMGLFGFSSVFISFLIFYFFLNRDVRFTPPKKSIAYRRPWVKKRVPQETNAFVKAQN